MVPVILSVQDGSPLVIHRSTLEDLERHWPYIKRGLKIVRSKQTKHSYWTPEHVRMELMAGRAELYFVADALEDGTLGVMHGFFVVTHLLDPFLHVPLGLFVWVAYAQLPGFDQAEQWIEQLARQRGMRFVETISPRPGMPRRLQKAGWYVAQTVLRKDLEDETEH